MNSLRENTPSSQTSLSSSSSTTSSTATNTNFSKTREMRTIQTPNIIQLSNTQHPYHHEQNHLECMRKIHSTSDVELCSQYCEHHPIPYMDEEHGNDEEWEAQRLGHFNFMNRHPHGQEFEIPSFNKKEARNKQHTPVVTTSIATSMQSQDKLLSSKPSSFEDQVMIEYEKAENMKTPDSNSHVILNVPSTLTPDSCPCGEHADANHHSNASSTATSSENSSIFSRFQPLQSFIHRYHEFEQHLLRRSETKRENKFRSQLELVTAINDHCDQVLHTYPFYRIFILSVIGGFYLSIGTILSGLLSSDLSSKAMQKLMIGISFICSFTMIVLSKSILFTEVNISVSVYLFKHDLIGIFRRSIFKVLKTVLCCFFNSRNENSHSQDIESHGREKHFPHLPNPRKNIQLMTLVNSVLYWLVCIAGNLLGTMLMSSILNGCLIWYQNTSLIQFLSNTTLHKIEPFQERGVNGWFLCVVSGMVANFMIGVASQLCSSAVTLVGKIAGLAIPVIAFAALGPQHAPANFGYFSHILVWRDVFGESFLAQNATTSLLTPEIKYVMELSWADAFAWNIVPAAVGNALGGFLLAFAFVFTFIK
ncbi:hypothetical protein C9374_006283 [Naegleria lovaniensis]|uniref:Uncharacterized protein n=1 Tax=Naegleria lovaniensis TaxID=51637 RepID=A0AA88GLQ3_NAELO|nr:uncharacterized protein C9374_006283 [Naegleria lovaniensis]KAG2381294.1 hypothetical protein C9374_006283 [Naegleria lovaniensis]